MRLTKENRFLTAIKEALEEGSEKRDPKVISMSSLGHCARQLAYRMHGTPGTSLTWRALGIFSDGNLHHDSIRSLLKKGLEGGCYSLQDQELSVSYEGISGHVDGVLRHDRACSVLSHGDLLLEVKSVNDRGYGDVLKKGELSFEYRCQVSGYLKALGLKQAVIILKNKNTAEISEFLYDLEEGLVNERLAIVKTVKASQTPDDVEREYFPDKKGKLSWRCGYCPFVETCWEDEGVTLVKEHKYQIDLDCYEGPIMKGDK